MKSLLVTGTDTDVGKTWISALLIRQLRTDGHSVGAYKPVCSGARMVKDQPVWDDVDALSAALQFRGDMSQVCPQRFRRPLAPNIAARLEESRVNEDALLRGFSNWESECEFLVVEGVGGLLCPVSDNINVADFFGALQRPILVIAANRLGVLNHTALTLEVAAKRSLPINGVILNDVTQPAEGDSAIVRDENAGEMVRLCQGTPLWHCEHKGTTLTSLNEAAAGTESLANLFA